MPLRVTLTDLRRELRAETGTSLSPTQGVQAQATMDIILARQQRELWDAYTWQHLKIWADKPLADGQAIYSYPVEMDFDQITCIYVATGVVRDKVNASIILSASPWTPLAYGISASMKRLGPSQQGTPRRWRNVASVDISGPTPITNPVGQFEVLPVPPTYPPPELPHNDMILRFEGQAPLSPLIADDDKCIIDSKAIILFAAAEMLATQKSEAAPMKLQKAQNYLRKLLADQGADKRTNYNMGGSYQGGNDPDKARRRIPYIDYIPG
jgi:hypothetical protein